MTQSHHGGPAMANDAQMPELDAAIERLKAATPKTAPWTVWDFSDRGEVPIDKEIAIILNAVVSGELTRADLCASGQQVRALALLEAARFIETMEQVDPPEPMTAEMLKAVAGAGLRNMAKRLAPLTPAQQPAVEPVPVAYQVRMSDGRWGTIFHHPDKPLGDHRPLYAYPPQPSASVAEAGYNDVIHALIKQHETVMRSKGRNPIDYTTKWSLAADAVAALQALKGDDANG